VSGVSKLQAECYLASASMTSTSQDMEDYKMSIPENEVQRQRLDLAAEQEMARLGIVRVPADYFRYRDFRYTNLQDALAQARRDAEIKQQAGAWSTSR
jgi:hypothetical protein